jgi:putative oxidoreductase
MKKIFSIGHPDRAFDAAMLILRVGIGVTMFHHGYGKLVHFSEVQEKFINFLGLGTSVSLALVVFAEFFCSILLVLGFMTRAALIPLIIDMAVAVFLAHSSDIFGKGELAFVYLIAFLSLTFTGPGRYSADGLLSRR